MRHLDRDDQAKWADWDWTSAALLQEEMATCLHAQWALDERSRAEGGGGGGGCGCPIC